MSVDAQDVLQVVEITRGAFKTIEALTRVGPDNAHDALLAIHAIIRTLQEGFDGRTSPEVVAAELAAIVNDLNIGTKDVATKFDSSDAD